MPRGIRLRDMRKERQVAHKDGTASVEDLPCPMVLYPGFYGAFFAYMSHGEAPIYVCACARKAVENYLRFRSRIRIPPRSDNPAMSYIFSPKTFPRRLVDDLMARGVPSDGSAIRHLRFRRCLCHECNRALPTYMYCTRSHGSLFVRNLGWYVNKRAYEAGVEPVTARVLYDTAPRAILDLVRLPPAETQERILELWNTDSRAALKLQREFGAQCRRVWGVLEDDVRGRFGVKRRGEEWDGETRLYNLVRDMYPQYIVRRHYRPGFLDGMELDIYIEELNVGIEYQGVQHYEAMEHLGGEEALQEVRKRDARKRRLCEAMGVRLVEVRWDEGVEGDELKGKMEG